jgi:REP-associated tyrosine transposase
MDVFFGDDDRRAYLELLVEMGEKHGVAYWGYCLMSNHVHVIAVPKRMDSLALAVGWAHHAYTRRINFREEWRGYPPFPPFP